MTDSLLHPARGRFVIVEGPDGAGKTDLCELLARDLRLQDPGREVMELREPGGTELGEQIRSILKDPASVICDEAELLLFCAARAQIYRQIIEPALSAGKWVITDRGEQSTIIYQGLARGLGEETVASISGFARGGTSPDRTLVLRVTPETASARMHQRDGEARDRIEGAIDMSVIREGYASISERDASAIDVDANGTRQQTLDNALQALRDLTHPATATA